METPKHHSLRVSPDVRNLAEKNPAVARQLRSLEHVRDIREKVRETIVPRPTNGPA